MTDPANASQTNDDGQHDSVGMDSPFRSKEQHVLVVEDHEPTARMVATVIEEAEPSISTYVVGNGRACLRVLRGEADATPPPDLVLLDLDLPEIHGLAVLEARCEDLAVRRVPTIVLSGSDDRETIEECYAQGANAFISKPGTFDEYCRVADAIVEFWFSIAGLPGRRA